MNEKNLDFYKNLSESLENYINQMKDPLTSIVAYAELLSTNFLQERSSSRNTEASLAGNQINEEVERVFEILENMKIARGVLYSDFEESSSLIDYQKKKNFNRPEPKTVLVVDDDKTICLLLKNILAHNGYKVNSVLSGNEALKKIKKVNFSIAFMDVKMPDMNGYETLKNIIDYYSGEKVQIPTTIMMTGYDVYTILEKCKDIGAYSLLIKPFLVDDLLKHAEDAEVFSQI